MNAFERYALFDRLLSTHRHGLTSERLMEAAGCSRTTLWRDMQEMRDVYGAPIANDGKKPCTWYYEAQSPEHGKFELPGLWLSAEELFAFVLSEQMFGQSGAGTLLGEKLRRLQPRVQQVFGAYTQHLWRIQVLRVQSREVHSVVFRVVGDALLKRRMLAFQYAGRGSGEISDRRVSPQRLTHYRDNWYLDAWDEGIDSLRTFAVERVLSPTLTDQPARDLTLDELLALRTPSFGIFAGPPIATAILLFSARVARWVCDEHWHAQAEKIPLADGRLLLSVPYADPRELIKEILRHGADVVVREPPELRRQVQAALQAALAGYGEESGVQDAEA